MMKLILPQLLTSILLTSVSFADSLDWDNWKRTLDKPGFNSNPATFSRASTSGEITVAFDIEHLGTTSPLFSYSKWEIDKWGDDGSTFQVVTNANNDVVLGLWGYWGWDGLDTTPKVEIGDTTSYKVTMRFSEPVQDLQFQMNGINGFIKPSDGFNSRDILTISGLHDGASAASPLFSNPGIGFTINGNVLTGDYLNQIGGGLSGQHVTDDGSVNLTFTEPVDEVVFSLVNEAGHFDPQQFVDELQTWSFSIGDLSFSKVMDPPEPGEIPVTSGLQLWLDANELDSLKLSKGRVTRWDDLSGQGHTAAAASSKERPTLVFDHNKPAIRFDSNLLVIDGGIFSPGHQVADVTVFTVLRSLSDAEAGTLFYEPVSPSRFLTHWTWADGRGYWDAGATGAGRRPTPSGAIPTNVYASYRLESRTSSSAGQAIYRDDTLLASDNDAVAFSGTNGDFYLGGFGSGFYQSVNIRELIVFDRSLDASETSAMEDYLAEKWGPSPLSTFPTATLSTSDDVVSGTFDVEVTFSQEAGGLEESDFVISNGETTKLKSNGNAAMYTLTVSPINEGAVSIFLPGDSARTDVGNGNLPSNVLDVAFSQTKSQIRLAGRRVQSPQPSSIPIENWLGNDDGDLYDNLAEYALATSPDSPVHPGQTSSLPRGLTLVETEQGLEATFLRPSVATAHVNYTLEGSLDGQVWSNLNIEPEISEIGSELEQVRYHGLRAALTEASGFVRLRFESLDDGTISHSPAYAWQETVIQPGHQSFGPSLLNEPLHAGRIDAVLGSFLDVRSSLPDESSLRKILQSSGPCYLEITQGEQAGYRYEIDEVSTTSKVIAIDTSESVFPEPSIDLASQSFVIRPHITLNQLFVSNEMRAGLSPAESDHVLFFREGVYETHFLLKGPQQSYWTRSADTTLADSGAQTIAPGTGVIVSVETPVTLRQLGMVRDHDFLRPLKAGYQLIANPWPADASTDDLSLNLETGFHSDLDPVNADQLLIFSNDISPDSAGFTGYFLFSDATEPYWTSITDTILRDVSTDTLLPKNRAAFLNLREAIATWNLQAK